VIQVWSDVKCHCFLIVRFQKLGQLAVIRVWDLPEQALRHLQLFVENSSLVFDHCQNQGIRVDVEVFVDHVETVLFAIVAQNELLFVCVGHFDGLEAYHLVDVTFGIRVDKAIVADPEA
jgi:hypothetical protein